MGDRRNTGDHSLHGQPGQSTQSQDWVALDWVRGEITDTLAQARQSLEAYVETPQDDTRLRFCQNYIHQIHGTLEMVEFYGAALLAEEMEGLTQALLDGALTDRDEALEVLMHAILQLPPYLEQVQAGRRDLPVVILPVLNDLRSARGESLLSETSLFTPDLSGITQPVSDEELDRMDSGSLIQLVKKLRQMYQFALVGFFKNPTDKSSLNYLSRVFERMGSLCEGLPSADIWPVTHALVQALVSGEVRNNPAVRNLLRQVDTVLGKLVADGPSAFNSPIPDDLLKNSLYYIARSSSAEAQTLLIRQQYRLDAALPDEETVSRERAKLSGPDREAMSSVVAALSEELMAIKDALDLYVRNPGGSLDNLAEQLPSLRQVGDTLAVLGLGIQRKVILEQVDALSGMVSSQSHDDNQLMDIAGSLLYVEATLSGMASEQNSVGLYDADEPADLRTARSAVIKEACAGLESAKEAIVDFTASDWNKDSLTVVPSLLISVCGSLEMIDQGRVAELVRAANHYVENVLLSSDQSPEWSNMELLADVLAGSEYYLERSGSGVDEQGESVLDLACESLEQLQTASASAQIKESDAISDEVIELAPLDVEEQELEFDLDIDFSETVETEISTEKEEATDELGFSLDDIELIELDTFGVADAGKTQESPVTDDIEIDGPGFELIDIDLSESTEVELEKTSVVSEMDAEEDDDELDEELIEIFVEEAGDVRELLAEYFPRWQANQDDQEALKEFRRGFHTLKGSGRMVGATVLGELGWSVERMLNAVLEKSINSTDGIVALVERVIAKLPPLVDDFANNRQQMTADVQVCIDEADAWTRGETLVVAPVEESSIENIAAEETIELSDDFDFDLEEEIELSADVTEEVIALEIDEVVIDGEELDLDISDLSIGEITVSHQTESEKSESILDSELVGIFSKEAVTHLQAVHTFVEQFNASAEDSLMISDDLQRALHTLKGSAGMAGVTQVADLTSAIEHMMKEFRSLGIQADETVISQLVQGSLLIDEGIQQVNHGADSSVEITGAHELINDVNALFERRVGEHGAAEHDETTTNVRSFSTFISENMDLVLDAVPALQAWNRYPEDELISSLQAGLLSLVDSAREVELDTFADLSEQMVVAYQAVQKQTTPISDSVLEALYSAHDQLTDMMDMLAGQQTPLAPEATLAQLQTVIDELEAEPAIEEIQEAAAETLEDIADISAVDIIADFSAISANDETPVEQEVFVEVVSESAQIEKVQVEEDSDPELIAIFLDEAMENLDAASTALYKWLDHRTDLAPLAELQRYLHTIKGGARMAGIDAVGDLGHELEDIYEALCLNRLQVTGDLINLLMRGHDTLEEMLGAVRSHKPSQPAKKLCKEIRKVMKLATDQVFVVENAEVEVSVDLPVAEVFPTEISIESSIEVPATTLELPDDLDLEMVGIFREEAGDLLDEIEQQVTGWQQEPENKEWPDLLMRSLHTLKGSARMTGLFALGEDSHNFEMKVLDIQEAGNASTSIHELGQIQADIHQSFESILAVLKTTGEEQAQEHALQQNAQGCVEETSNVVNFPNAVVDDAAGRIVAPASQLLLNKIAEARADSSDKEMVRVPANLLDELVNLAGETSISRSRIEQQISDFGFTLTEMNTTIDRLQEQLRRLDIETQAQILSRHEGDVANHPDFDPLEMDQYSELTQLSRALVESATDLMDLKEGLEEKNRDSETLLLQQSRINTELQEGLMRTRMLPFNRMMPRLRRIVRQVSNELGKQVELKVVNAEGEMDRSVMERMIAPLEHMLRNAIDHGIEDSPAVRKASGKNETGEISLNIAREGGEIVLSLADDGRGLNLDAVRKKAIEKGLLEDGAVATDSEVSHMIFQPGFTTATNVTQISGRGVGMDVVNNELKQLGGHIEIHTEEGQGTEFEIRLPFTLSVNRALMVNVGEEQYAIPLNTLEGIVRLSPFELESHYSGDDQGLEYAGRRYQLRYLGDLLYNRKPRLGNVTHELPVLLIRAGDTGIAIQVDSLVASREVVVKNIGPQFAGLRGVSGATILGDGSVVVILDPVGLLLGHTRQQMSDTAQPAAPVVEQENNLVMVVDDSVTVRKVTGRLLKRNGYRTVFARDGVEAMALLEEHKPAVMLLDIEMPRMDGFEVATAVRNDPELRELPIIMITSRTGEKHRQRAQEIGVNEYMGKPFQEGFLLETVGGFAKRND